MGIQSDFGFVDYRFVLELFRETICYSFRQVSEGFETNQSLWFFKFRVYYGYYDIGQVQKDVIDMNFMLKGSKISIDGSTYFEFKLFWLFIDALF